LTACTQGDNGGEIISGSAFGEESVTLTVVYTNDEHGWMAGEQEGQGAAELAGLWATEYSNSDVLLVLSGGDNWTGPAISTWFDGEGMVEVMNTMGYAASAVGNHEFDFGLDGLRTRTTQADFPYLGANIRYKTNGQIPTDLGIQPYTIVEAAGLQIGLIGLSYMDTPLVTDPEAVAGFDFIDYGIALREYVPVVRQAGADLVFVITHTCAADLERLARDVEDLGIAFFGGGHCHEEFSDQESGAVILIGGSNYRSYAYATFEIDPSTVEVNEVDFGVASNARGTPQPQVAEIVAHWQELTDAELDVVIGYLENEIPQASPEMAALITETRLWAYPADVAVSNWGGMRDRIPAGEITFADIISVMPFGNVLIDMALNGEQLQQVLAFGGRIPPVGGIHLESGQWVFDGTGDPLDPGTTYHILIDDYLYAGGDGYTMLAEFDPDAYDTTIDYTQPLVDWILAQESSLEKPLDEPVRGLLEK
jgi:5'-nucleotidase/UDP-sugar diphosphatase